MTDLLFQRIRYTDPIRYRVFDWSRTMTDGSRLVGVTWKQGKVWVAEGIDMTWKTRQAAGEYLAKEQP